MKGVSKLKLLRILLVIQFQTLEPYFIQSDTTTSVSPSPSQLSDVTEDRDLKILPSRVVETH